jgi:hypothetical protein
MPVASPYAVFRAADLVWASPLQVVPQALPHVVPKALPIAFAAAPLSSGHRHPRPRKRLAPLGVVQGELFALQPG